MLTVNNNNFYRSSYLTDIKLSPQGFMGYEEGSNLVNDLDAAKIDHIYFYQLDSTTLYLNNNYVQCTYYMTSFQSLLDFEIIKDELDGNQVILSKSFATEISSATL